jgi:CRISPR-associated protein Csd1
MTILQALARRYDQLAATNEAPVPGLAPSQISFTLVLDRDGNYITTQDDRTGEGKRLRPRTILAPAAPKRTVGIASGAFWDKTSYVLGRTATDETASAAKQAKGAERLIKEHAAFLARHEKLLDGSNDIGCAALLAFLRGWTPDRYDTLVHADAMLDQNVAFRLEGDIGFIHDRPAARAALMTESGARAPGPEGMCLVTGEMAPIARLHPSIKGVPGAQSSGAALVSFNHDAFTSYGKTQGANAPVSEAAAFAYTTALNALLAGGRTDAKGRPVHPNRVTLGETTVPFWAEHGDTESLLRAVLADDDLRELPGDHAGQSLGLRGFADAFLAEEFIERRAPVRVLLSAHACSCGRSPPHVGNRRSGQPDDNRIRRIVLADEKRQHHRLCGDSLRGSGRHARYGVHSGVILIQ